MILILPFLLGVTGCKQMNARRSAEINDEVIYQHKLLMSSLESFIGNLESRDEVLIGESLDQLSDIAASGLEAMEVISTPECNAGFLPAASEVFMFYKETAAGSYADIARFYSMDSISYDQYDSLQVIVKEVEEAQSKADAAFLEAQQAFARECGFKLVKSMD